MIKFTFLILMMVALAGCAASSPTVNIDSSHPAHADAPAAPAPAVSNTLAIDGAQPTTAPATKEATDEHHHHGHH
jgi:hypothetical protein